MAKWIDSNNCPDGWRHYECSNCHNLAPFYYDMKEDWDEGMDGEWFSLGMSESGVNEFITPFCPYCGEPMDYAEAMHSIYGCQKCVHFDPNCGYTEYCIGCGDYPWDSDALPTKWELKGE